jgi:hypothetical protein
MDVNVPDFLSTDASAFFVSWFLQAINDADTRKHNTSFFMVFNLGLIKTSLNSKKNVYQI